ncbi:MAG: TaqI-like C-terminal specificity domain-containing protein [Anaerolineae bacterium]
MTDTQVDTHLLQELVETHHDADPDMAEANVAEAFVARFFEALGWDTSDPLVWNRQSYVRGAGYADAALQIDHRPVLFVEVKRFGGVARPQEDVNAHAQLFGEDPILSQAERGARGIDRTPEEKQAMRYARAAGIRWAILTNFERLLLFNADEERVVLAFDAPEQYLERVDDLELLTPAGTTEQFHSQLQWYADLQRKPEIDEDFYRFLSEWRLRLAQAIYDHNQGPDSPLRDTDGTIDLDLLRQAVQRTLDRLIIIRYADDVGFLKQHDLLENELVGFLNRQAYTVEYEFQENDVNRLYRAFYRHHDTTIFAPDHVCERVRIPNDTLVELVREISAISFRKFSSDILGNTYESYLGQRLLVDDDIVQAESDRALRKEGGIYYTPSYIVRYIVDHTLGRWLYGTADGRADGEPLPDASRRTLSDLEGLRLADPAMGSGSFLIYAFEVLADFYESENERIRQANAARWDAWGKKAMKEGMFGKDNDAPELEEPAPDYVSRILQDHLYGVDLDPEAVEIAGVNLILRAFDRLRGKDERRKLPLILGQNLKVGNSLISGVADPDDLAPFQQERRQLIDLRQELAALERDEARAAKLTEIEAVAAPVNAALNESLETYFDDVPTRRPFNWEIAFPEVFDPRAPQEEQGFAIVIGNPPYIRSLNLKSADPATWAFYSEAYRAASKGEYDIYLCFVERGYQLLAREGELGYILPNKWFTTRVGARLRELLSDESLLRHIVDFGHFQVFDDVTTYTCLLFLKNVSNEATAVDILIDARHSSQPLPDDGESLWQSGKIHTHALGEEPWSLTVGAVKALLSKLDALPKLGDIASIFMGTGTRADPIFVLKRRSNGYYSPHLDRCVELEADLLKPSLTGRDVSRYHLVRNTLLLFPYRLEGDDCDLIPEAEMKRDYPAAWAYLNVAENREKLEGRSKGKYKDREDWYCYSYPRNMGLLHKPKLVVPDVAAYAQAGYDNEGRYIVDTMYGILLKDDDWSPLAATALLNSNVLTFFLNQTGTRLRGGYFRMKTAYLEPFPVPAIDFSDPADVAAHDALAELAQRMLDLNKTHQAATDAFADAVHGHERRPTLLRRFLTEQKDFVTRHALLDANDEGEVNAIAVDEEGDGLVVRAQVEGIRRDVVRLEVDHEDLRLYLLLALRAFLHEHRRKRVWSRGTILGGVLEALEVPRLASATPDGHQRRVAQVMENARRLLPHDLPHHGVGLDRKGAPLHLTAASTISTA